MEAMFLRVFLLMRAYHLVSGFATLTFDRRRYVRPLLGWSALALLVGESAWLARVSRRRGGYAHALSAMADVGVVGAGMVLCSVALPTDEQFNAANWMFPVGLMSGVGAMAALPNRRDGFLATTALAASFAVATGNRSKRRGAPMVLAITQFVNCAIAGDVLTRRVRATTADIGRLRREAVLAADARGRNESRAQLQRDLHTPTLATLHLMRARLARADHAGAQRAARQESTRLRLALQGATGSSDTSLRSRLATVVERYADSPLRIEFVDDGGDLLVAEGITEVLCDLLEAVLAQSAAVGTLEPGEGPGRRVVVAFTSDEDGLELNVRAVLGADRSGPALDERLVETMRHFDAEVLVESMRDGTSLVTMHVRTTGEPA